MSRLKKSKKKQRGENREKEEEGKRRRIAALWVSKTPHDELKKSMAVKQNVF